MIHKFRSILAPACSKSNSNVNNNYKQQIEEIIEYIKRHARALKSAIVHYLSIALLNNQKKKKVQGELTYMQYNYIVPLKRCVNCGLIRLHHLCNVGNYNLGNVISLLSCAVQKNEDLIDDYV